MSEQRVRFTERQRPGAFNYPFATTLLTATTEGAAQTLATVREGSNAIVKRLVACNQTGSAVAVTVYFIPSGGTIGASNREITAISVPANSNLDLTEMIGGLYSEGTVVKAFAASGTAILMAGYIEGRP